MTLRNLHQRPRVLKLIKTGEGATWAVRLTRELIASGIDVHIYMPSGPRVPDYRDVGATVHIGLPDFSPTRPWQVPARIQSLREVVERVKPVALHSHFVSSTLLARLSFGRQGPMRIFQVPGPLHLEHTLPRMMDLRSATLQDRWIGGCTWTRDRYLAAGISASHVSLAWYGNDFDGIPGRLPPTGALQQLLNIEPTDRVIGMVAYAYAPKRWLGQTRGLKGHEDLIDAFDLVADQFPKTHLCIIGGAWAGADGYLKTLHEYAATRGKGRIHFAGTRHDVGTLYRDVAIAVHPSHSENLGGAAESQMIGVPTIATNIGGFPDIVEDGVTGWLVPAKSPQLLATALRSALSDPALAAERALRGQAVAFERLRTAFTAGQVLGAYQQFGII